MYQGKYAKQPARRCRRGRKRASTMLLSLLLLTTLVVSGTLAYITTSTSDVKNVFKPSEVTCQVTEKFDGEKKTEVNVENTSNIDAWLRVKLVTYRVNENGDRIGGTAFVPAFTPGDGWVENGEFYYYTSPVAPDEKPDSNLIDSISLITYDDVDGGRQVIEVMAEAFQSVPENAVQDSWGVIPSKLS